MRRRKNSRKADHARTGVLALTSLFSSEAPRHYLALPSNTASLPWLSPHKHWHSFFFHLISTLALASLSLISTLTLHFTSQASWHSLPLHLNPSPDTTLPFTSRTLRHSPPLHLISTLAVASPSLHKHPGTPLTSTLPLLGPIIIKFGDLPIPRLSVDSSTSFR